MSHVVNIDELPHTHNAHEFVGANFDAPVSLILVHSAPGEGPVHSAYERPGEAQEGPPEGGPSRAPGRRRRAGRAPLQ